MRFKEYLNEMPIKLGNINGLPSKIKFREDIIRKFNNLKTEKLFDNFYYYIDDNILFVVKDSELVLYILFKEDKNSFIVKVIENISGIKGLAFKVYRAILDKTKYNEIITGDMLSNTNIKSHKNALESFKIYLRVPNEQDKLVNSEDIDKIYRNSNKNELFVLKESERFSGLNENYGTEFDEYINFYFKESNV